MSADDLDQLKKALQVQRDLDTRPGVTDETVKEIAASILFRHPWEDLLQSGPVALACLGNCVLVAASETARGLKFTTSNEFQYLKSNYLQANLVDSTNLGREAFLTAQTNMAFIYEASRNICNDVALIVQILADPETAKTQLVPRLNHIQQATDKCYNKAKGN
ncbi:hypothetical protein VTH06DRAFT_6870 [Thermothelomyces fergusii]